MGQRAERIAFGAFFVAALFAIWEVVTALGVEPPIILPSPADVAGTFRNLFSSSDIWPDFAASGQELFYGLALAAVVGVAAGLAIGWYPRLGYFVDPFVNFLYAVPRVALGPLLIVWLGIGLGSKVALVFLISVFPVLINTCSGIRSLDPHLLRVARCFGASDIKIFRTIALPGSVPFILGGLRLAVGQSLIGVFVAELLGAQYGIGAMIEDAGQQFQTDKVFAGLLIFAAVGMLLTAIVRGLERRFDAWRV
jgi:NitT/TauT family transport system permease protein